MVTRAAAPRIPQASKTYLEKKFETFPGISVDEVRRS